MKLAVLSGSEPHDPHRPPLSGPPLDYVPTAPVHKPRRALHRAVRASLYAVTALVIAFFAPIAIAALAGLGVVLLGLRAVADWVGSDE